MAKAAAARADVSLQLYFQFFLNRVGTAWLSSNPNTAAVSAEGVVTANNPGEKIIQATYGIKIAKFNLQVLPGDTATLSGIRLNGNPPSGFDPSVRSYVVNVPNSMSGVSFSAALSDIRATMKINETAVENGELFQSGALLEGVNVFNFVVTAEDGRTMITYTVTVNCERD